MRALGGILLIICFVGISRADTPLSTSFTYQGRLNQSGAPASGLYDLQFKLFDAATQGVQIGRTVCLDNVTVSDGLLTVSLDFGQQYAGAERFLEIDVRTDTGLPCGSSAGFVTLSPRQPLTVAPQAGYALDAGNSATLEGKSAAFFQDASNLVTGTLDAAVLPTPFMISGQAATCFQSATNTANTFGAAGACGYSTATTAQTYGVYGENSSTNGRGVYGYATSATGASDGVVGRSDSVQGRGIWGWATSGDPSSIGVRGESAGDGRGVYGLSNGPSGIGVHGQTTGTTTGWGGYFEGRGYFRDFVGIGTTTPGVQLDVVGNSNPCVIQGVQTSNQNFVNAICGVATASTGSQTGVYGESSSSGGIGVVGLASSTSGTTFGGYFNNNSTGGTGVVGSARALTGATVGGYFDSASPNGTGVSGVASSSTGNTVGVSGFSNTGRGVHGKAGSGAPVTYGVYGESNSSQGFGVYGLADSGTSICTGVFGSAVGQFSRGVHGNAGKIGVLGEATEASGWGGRFTSSGAAGYGVFATATSLSGTTYGGYFESDSDAGYGLYGSAAGGVGLKTTYGVYGITASRLGAGVYGVASDSQASLNTGVKGESRGSNGIGVDGFATDLSGPTVGVAGRSASTAGTGVIGFASATSGQAWGVYGVSASTSGRGVSGYASAAVGQTYGVLGETNSVNTNPGAFAVWGQGRLSATMKLFRIDHPDDPENKYLLHYCAESSESINFYSGKVLLDEAGGAVVELPHYFAKINRDPRYTLTAIGAPMPLLHVAEEIDEGALAAGAQSGPGQAVARCRFRIAGGVPGAKVSWRVEAVRNDLWVRRNGTPVELDKEGSERGTYQHPELYGQPAEKGLTYHPQREQAAPPEATGSAN